MTEEQVRLFLRHPPPPVAHEARGSEPGPCHADSLPGRGFPESPSRGPGAAVELSALQLGMTFTENRRRGAGSGGDAGPLSSTGLSAGDDGCRTDPAGEGFAAIDPAMHNQICTGCSCLCDDISFSLRDGLPLQALNLCETGWKRIEPLRTAERTDPVTPEKLRGEIRLAARLLADNGPVLVLGADSLDEAGIRASRRLAKALGGLCLPRPFEAIRRFHERVRRFGWATALLDDVRDRADLVFFWRADPLRTHHRHLSRYSFFARGRCTERGHQDRKLAAVLEDQGPLETLCHHFFRIPPERDADLLDALANPSAPARFEHRDLPLLAGSVQRAAFIALFVDPERVGDDTLDRLFRWSAALNNEGIRRHVILPLWSAGTNMEGFCQVSLETCATPWGWDFSGQGVAGDGGNRGSEISLQGVRSLLLVAAGDRTGAAETLPGSLRDKPRVVLDPFGTLPLEQGDLVIRAALPGFECGGVFWRADGLPFEVPGLKGLRDRGLVSPETVLSEIARELP